MSDTNDEPIDAPMTQEQIDAYNKGMDEFYKINIPRVKKQCEYEKLLADVEEARLRRVMAEIRRVQLMVGPPKEPETPPGPDGNQEITTQKRTLKTAE